MCPNCPVALDPALLFPMRHGSADVQQDLPSSSCATALMRARLAVIIRSEKKQSRRSLTWPNEKLGVRFEVMQVRDRGDATG